MNGADIPSGYQGYRAVVVGGGTGAPVSIRTLLAMGFDVAAVVAMADDGGSSGILRERAGAVPPGDIRKCLVAMASDQDSPLVRAFRYRFDYASNHALGNLVLTALADTGSTFPEAIRICERMLDCRGRVFPSTLDNVTLNGRTRDGRNIEGQSAISHSDCAVSRVFLGQGEVQAYGDALTALSEADLIVLGPGSLFTSIIPNLLIPGVVDAITSSHAATVFVCSCADMQGETWGLSCAEHVEALLDHGMRGHLDYVLLHDQGLPAYKPGPATAMLARVDPDSLPVPTVERVPHSVHPLLVTPQLIARIKSAGPHVITRDFVDPIRPTWHDPVRLASAFEEVCAQCRLTPR